MIENKSLGSRIFDGINVVILISVALLCLLPMWYILMISISDKAAVESGVVSFLPVGFNLLSYNKIMADPKFITSFFVSVKRVFLGTAVTTIVIILMAYPLSKSKKDFPGRDIVMWVLVFCMLFSGGLIPWYMTMKSYGLTDSIWGLVLSGGVPFFNVILVMNFIRNLPEALEEAARVDGAGPWRILFQMIVPLSKPVLATIVLFTMVGHWNEFFQGMILSTKESSFPLQTYIQQLVVSVNMSNMTGNLTPKELAERGKLNNDSLNAAKIFVAMIPVLIIYPFLQKYFVKGITLGSVKE
jgi:putative aldouronate transport system permease protein